MKTNSKQVKEAIQKYIVECFNTEEFEDHDGTTKKSIEIVLTDFARVALYKNNLHNLKSYQACFVDWIMGLPHALAIEFRTFAILELMAGFGLPLPEGKEEVDGEELFRNLIYLNLIDMAKREGIDYMTIYNRAIAKQK